MPQARRIITYIATSADGYIARSNGSVTGSIAQRPTTEWAARNYARKS